MSDLPKMLYDESADPSVDVSPDVDAEDFDFGAFLDGVRATRRAVKVYARADLVAQMDEVAGGYRDDLPAQAKKKILAEVTRLSEEFEASGRWFVTEARSKEWIDDFRAKTARRLGVDPADSVEADGDLTPEQREARKAVLLEQVAAQVVVPSGVTAEGLARLGQVNVGELNKIVTAMAYANSQSAAKGMARDFSPAPSAKSGTAGSKRR